MQDLITPAVCLDQKDPQQVIKVAIHATDITQAVIICQYFFLKKEYASSRSTSQSLRSRESSDK